MKRLSIPAVLLTTVLLAGPAAAPVAAQGDVAIPRVCLDESTTPEQIDCATKYHAFWTYLDNMGRGIPTYTLPPAIADALQPHYPGIDVSQWRFGYRLPGVFIQGGLRIKGLKMTRTANHKKPYDTFCLRSLHADRFQSRSHFILKHRRHGD